MLTPSRVICTIRMTCLALAVALLAAGPAQALTIDLSGMSSEPSTNPAGDLTATMAFSLTNCGATCDLTLRIENKTDTNGSGVEYDINQAYFNASFAVINAADLTFVSATKSDTSVVTGGWTFHEQDVVNDADTKADGFGVFDFSLIDGVGGSAVSQVLPGEWIDFSSPPPARPLKGTSIGSAPGIRRRPSPSSSWRWTRSRSPLVVTAASPVTALSAPRQSPNPTDWHCSD